MGTLDRLSGLPGPAGFGKADVRPDINVTPMIDVMMCLLIIFMVVTPVLTQYAGTPPDAVNVVRELEGDVVVVGIDANGTVYLGEDTIPSRDLAALLRQTYAMRKGDHLMYLRSDKAVDYRVVLDAIDAAREAGVRRIGLIATPVAPAAVQAIPASAGR
jgi:biopolymer transport protein ExbD